jgi:hypothetical protein
MNDMTVFLESGLLGLLQQGWWRDNVLAIFPFMEFLTKEDYHRIAMAIIYLGSTLTTFSLAFLKAFQSRNIVAGHYWAAWITSWLVTSGEVASVSFIVMGGWVILLTAGIGGSFGCIAAMAAHERLFKSKATKSAN